VELDEENSNSFRKTVLGSNILNENHVLQHVVKRNTWFGCYCDNDNEYSLVGCTGYQYFSTLSLSI
jgi:predicted cupin superfamily sugar epimerase